MPTHNHKAVQTDYPDDLIRRERYTYTRYFNSKYHRRGRLGEKNPYQLSANGIHHTQTLLNYVIRQALHHGLVSTPFEYKHCSANCYFKKELGHDQEEKLRSDVVDAKYVQEIYITPRNFLFQETNYSESNPTLPRFKL